VDAPGRKTELRQSDMISLYGKTGDGFHKLFLLLLAIYSSPRCGPVITKFADGQMRDFSVTEQGIAITKARGERKFPAFAERST
jgi:hypothetical protein